MTCLLSRLLKRDGRALKKFNRTGTTIADKLKSVVSQHFLIELGFLRFGCRFYKLLFNVAG